MNLHNPNYMAGQIEALTIALNVALTKLNELQPGNALRQEVFESAEHTIATLEIQNASENTIDGVRHTIENLFS